MIVPLLPMFLVANLTVNESNWKYGPELIYDVRINGTEYRIVDEKDNQPIDETKLKTVIGTENIFTYVHNTTMKLKCRPKNSTNFSCQFHEPRVISSFVESNGNYRKVNDSKLYRDKNPVIADYTFEFNGDREIFNDHPYVASSSITGQRLDVVRTIMDMINVPVYLTKLPQGEVGVVENSTVGIRCSTKYVVNPIKLLEGFEGKDTKRSYEIFLAPNGKFQKDGGYSIVRYRYPQKCWALMVGRYSYEYEKEIYRLPTRTDMIITENTFYSKDRTSFILFNRDRRDQNDVGPIGEETISLTLEDIVPATGPLPIIRNPETFGMSGTRVFHSRSVLGWLFQKEQL